MKKIYSLLAVLLVASYSFAQISLTATAGTAGPTSYTTLKGAFDAINAGTHQGVVTILVNGNTTESASAVLNASGTAGAAYTGISITPNGERTITGNLAAPLIDLNGADNLTIDGLNTAGNSLIISNTNTGAAAGTSTIRYINDASNNTIQNTSILGASTSIALGTIYFGTGTTTGNDNNTIFNCNVAEAAGGFPVNAIISAGNSAAGQENSGITISGNAISNFFNADLATVGILVSTGSTDWTILNNKFFQTAARTFTTGNLHRIIQVTAGENYNISNNTIGYSAATATGVYTLAGTVATRFIAIDLAAGTGVASSVQNNSITKISMNTSNTANVTTGGIFTAINVSAGNVDVGTITGNNIGSTTGTGSILITPTVAGAASILIYSTSTGTVNISNNLFGAIDYLPSGVFSGNINVIQTSGASGNITISKNIIGNTTPDNIRIGTLGTTTGNGILRGILNSNSGTISISLNTVRNLTHNSTSGTALVRGLEQQQGLATVTENVIANLSANGTSNSASTFPENVGILISGGLMGVLVDQNTISNLANINATTTGTVVQGIYLGGTNGVTVTRNKIFGFTNASTSVSTTSPAIIAGINIRDANIANPMTIANNMISLGTGQVTNTAIIGIWNGHLSTTTQNNYTVRIYYNSINVAGTVTSGAQPSFGYYRGDFSANAPSVPTVDIKNNIITNNRSGGTGKHYAIANGYGTVTSNPAGWAGNASDYNILKSTSNATFGYWSGDQNFNGWKTASGNDQHSLSEVTVTYVDPASDLHLATNANSGVDGVGTPLSGFPADFDNDARDLIAPDPGADEFAQAPLSINVEYFKGKKLNSANVLNWKAGCTSASVIFDIERGNDTRRFVSIANFSATRARCSEPFNFTDNAPAFGTNYYRLKMTEIDGQVNYSSFIAILNKDRGFEVISLLPTLVQGTAVLNITSAQKTRFEILVTDVLGKVIKRQTAVAEEGSSTINMNLTSLAKGAYQLSIYTTDGMPKTIRFVKQ